MNELYIVIYFSLKFKWKIISFVIDPTFFLSYKSHVLFEHAYVTHKERFFLYKFLFDSYLNMKKKLSCYMMLQIDYCEF